MSTLYRPKVISYRLPNGATRTADGRHVNRHTPGAVRVVGKSPTWWGRYTDGAGVRHQVSLDRNKDLARRMLAKIAGDSQLARAGIRNPFDEHRERALAGHLDDFGRVLAAKGNTPGHVGKTVARCRAVVEGIDAEAFEDLQPSAVLEFLAGLRAEGEPWSELPEGEEWFTLAQVVAAVGVHAHSVARILRRQGLDGRGNGKARRYPRAAIEALRAGMRRGASVATSNHYLAAVKSFTHWLVKDGRLPFDPLACLSRQNAEVDPRRRRRTLDPADFAAFLDAARGGAAFRGLTGAARAVLYHLAARSGLRASELASLAPASFDFAAGEVTVAAGYSKRRRVDRQPLAVDVARLVRAFAEGKPARSLLWPGSWPDAGAEMVRRDLAAAGIAATDAAGLVYDFHALRHQFITDLAAAGVHPKDAQALARHSTITLTMDHYTHVRPSNLQDALDRLPDLSAAPKKPAGKARRRA